MIHTVACVLTVLLGTVASQNAGAPNSDRRNLLLDAVEAVGAREVRSVRFSGSGSSYSYEGEDDEDAVRHYARVEEFSQQVDLDAMLSTTEVRRISDGVEALERDKVDSERPWNDQLAIWLNPYVFLTEALDQEVEIAPVRYHGADYTRVSFEAPGGRRLEGYIDEGGLLERIQTWVEDADGEIVPCQAVFRFYEETGAGGRFPGLIVWKRDGRLMQLVRVTDVSVTRG